MGVSIFVMLAVDDHYLDPLEIIKWWYFIIPFFFLLGGILPARAMGGLTPT